MLPDLLLNDEIRPCLQEQFPYPLICASGRVEFLYSLAKSAVERRLDEEFSFALPAQPYGFFLCDQFQLVIVILACYHSADGPRLFDIGKPHIQVILVLRRETELHVIQIRKQFHIVQIRRDESRIHLPVPGSRQFEPELFRLPAETLPVRKYGSPVFFSAVFFIPAACYDIHAAAVDLFQFASVIVILCASCRLQRRFVQKPVQCSSCFHLYHLCPFTI